MELGPGPVQVLALMPVLPEPQLELAQESGQEPGQLPVQEPQLEWQRGPEPGPGFEEPQPSMSVWPRFPERREGSTAS